MILTIIKMDSSWINSYNLSKPLVIYHLVISTQREQRTYMIKCLLCNFLIWCGIHRKCSLKSTGFGRLLLQWQMFYLTINISAKYITQHTVNNEITRHVDNSYFFHIFFVENPKYYWSITYCITILRSMVQIISF